ncbi:MAG: DNA polymerase III subunit chi [Alphaproteobacteria bacterium]|nr:DNA polymerase III subunit chi [Alphaproteobacteria bacterium]
MAHEVNFYHLTVLPVERALPKLVEKIYAGGKKAVIRVSSVQRAEELDQLLWTYSPNDFLPHGLAHDTQAAEHPIVITEKDENPNQSDILLMVGDAWSERWQDFERCLLMFDGHRQDELAFARRQWQTIKEQGVTLTYWKQTEQGSWQKAA